MTFTSTLESVADQQTRLAREESARKAKELREQISALAAKPLVGTRGDLGQGTLFDEPGARDLFEPPSAETQLS